jgi:hypothetical protein
MVQNRTGSRWFLSVANLRQRLTQLGGNQTRFDPQLIVNFSTDYKLRTYTSGCYFLDETHHLWSGPHFAEYMTENSFTHKIIIVEW